MKKKLLLVSVLVFTLLFGTALGAVGASNFEQIKAALNKSIVFNIDGNSWTPKDANGNTIYPITYNNTNYLPVRAVGEALGVDIGWNGATNTISLGKGSSDNATQPNTTNSGDGLSRNKPASIGATVKYNVENIIDNYTAEISIQEVIRGDAAWNLVKAANMFNDEAPAGYEYVLAKINFKVVSNKNIEAAVDINQVNFKLVSSEGKDYDSSYTVAPEPAFGGNLYIGATSSGWAPFIVKTDDQSPLITFGRKYDGTKGVWFKLQ